MQRNLAAVSLLIAIGAALYSANLSRSVTRLREQVGRLQQERLLRDWLFDVRSQTFVIPPSKGVEIRFVFSINGKTDFIELLRWSHHQQTQDREYTLLTQFDEAANTWRGGFLVQEGPSGSISGRRTIKHPLLTTEEIGRLLGRGPDTFTGFGRGEQTTTRADGREIKSWYEVSEWDPAEM